MVHFIHNTNSLSFTYCTNLIGKPFSKNFQIILLENNSNEENDATKISDSSKIHSNNSNGVNHYDQHIKRYSSLSY